jgi:hypothetical protein
MHISPIAKQLFAEFAATSVLGVTACCFAATPAGAGLIATVLAVRFAASVLFRFLGANSQGEWLSAGSFALFAGRNVQILAHEAGHAGLAHLLYKNAQASIRLFPFQGGATTYSTSALTPFGKMLGWRQSEWLVTAGGAGTSLLLSSLSLGLGLACRKKHPILSKYLLSCAVFDFLYHINYAASTFFASPLNVSHDFVHLAQMGLSPIIPIIGMIAIPILLVVSHQIMYNRSN